MAFSNFKNVEQVIALYPLKIEREQFLPKAGTGTGTVTGGGIDCGADCTEVYVEGTVLNLKAIPDADATFAGWLVNGEQVTGAIPVTDEIIVTAVFEQQ